MCSMTSALCACLALEQHHCGDCAFPWSVDGLTGFLQARQRHKHDLSDHSTQITDLTTGEDVG